MCWAFRTLLHELQLRCWMFLSSLARGRPHALNSAIALLGPSVKALPRGFCWMRFSVSSFCLCLHPLLSRCFALHLAFRLAFGLRLLDMRDRVLFVLSPPICEGFLSRRGRRWDAVKFRFNFHAIRFGLWLTMHQHVLDTLPFTQSAYVCGRQCISMFWTHFLCLWASRPSSSTRGVAWPNSSSVRQMKPLPSRSNTLKASTSSSSVSVSFIFLAIRDENSGKSMVPFPSASTPLIMSYNWASVGFWSRIAWPCPTPWWSKCRRHLCRKKEKASLNSAVCCGSFNTAFFVLNNLLLFLSAYCFLLPWRLLDFLRCDNSCFFSCLELLKCVLHILLVVPTWRSDLLSFGRHTPPNWSVHPQALDLSTLPGSSEPVCAWDRGLWQPYRWAELEEPSRSFHIYHLVRVLTFVFCTFWIVGTCHCVSRVTSSTESRNWTCRTSTVFCTVWTVGTWCYLELCVM